MIIFWLKSPDYIDDNDHSFFGKEKKNAKKKDEKKCCSELNQQHSFKYFANVYSIS